MKVAFEDMYDILADSRYGTPGGWRKDAEKQLMLDEAMLKRWDGAVGAPAERGDRLSEVRSEDEDAAIDKLILTAHHLCTAQAKRGLVYARHRLERAIVGTRGRSRSPW